MSIQHSIPRLNLNGTSKVQLVNNLQKASKALREAMKALDTCTPHGRDFAVIDPGALMRATHEHRERVATLTHLHGEIADIWSAVMDQKPVFKSDEPA